MLPLAKPNLFAVRTSVEPSDLIREYLSSSNGKNVSLVPAVTTADNSLSVIFTVSYFLKVMKESFKETDSIWLTIVTGKHSYHSMKRDIL